MRLVARTQTCKFLPDQQKPDNCKASYYNPQPEEKTKEGLTIKRIRGAYEGNQGEPYPEDTAAYIADLTTMKLILNKVVSIPNAS